jgi:hypothetical protein
MDVDSEALYLDLLEDLSLYLTKDQYERLVIARSADWYIDSSTKQVASVALANAFLKKFRDDTSEGADAAALSMFVSVNNDCEQWKLQLQSSKDEVLFGEFKLAVYNFLYPKGRPLVSSFGQIFDQSRPGPGASIGARGTDFYTKLFSSPLTATKDFLYDIYVNNLLDTGPWGDAESFRASMFGSVKVVAGNRLSFVPKNVSISRTICTEPNLNMFFQLGLGAILERRLRQSTKIDLSVQPEWNRELAKLGSLDFKENSSASLDGLTTIDLSSASDSMSLKMLKEVLPNAFYGWLTLLRSPSSTLPNGSELKLSMVSTMGNGFTFPLQTMLFSCAVLAAARFRYRVERFNEKGRAGTFGVFGDDIICGKSIAADVCHLLGILGFRVNSEKSFLEGPFRESCGYDYFNGHNVRGVYCKTLQTTQARYALINQLNLWTARNGIPLPKVCKRLLASVRYLPVPVWDNDDAGIRVTYKNLSKAKWSKRYQSLTYRRWVPKAAKLRIGDGIVTVPKGCKPRIYNPEGLLTAFLHGSIERGYINVRQRTVRYSTKVGHAPNWDRASAQWCAPNWDTTPVGSGLPPDISLSNFGWAVAANVSSNLRR